jgi:hypothetical protein
MATVQWAVVMLERAGVSTFRGDLCRRAKGGIRHPISSGDEIAISRHDGSTAQFRVTRVERFAKDEFPTQTVDGDLDHAGLRLITCGGEFDRQVRSYPDNIVVFAELVGSSPPVAAAPDSARSSGCERLDSSYTMKLAKPSASPRAIRFKSPIPTPTAASTNTTTAAASRILDIPHFPAMLSPSTSLGQW